MKHTIALLLLLPCVIYGASLPEPRQQLYATATNAEIVSLAEQLYSGDTNKAVGGDVTLNVQYKASSTQTSSGTDFASQKLFGYVNEAKLFARPTFSRLIALLDNYVKTTGTAETVTSGEVTEQNAFVDEIFRTTVFSRLSSFFTSKGYYTSTESFKADFKEMWFGLYTRTKGPLDSSGFEHAFSGEIHGGKISGFHSWVQFYLLEKKGEINYLSYSADGPIQHNFGKNMYNWTVGSLPINSNAILQISPKNNGAERTLRQPWTGYPDVYGFQFKWGTYLKSLGSMFLGTTPEFDLAVYTLCYVTRPDSLCTLSMGGQTLKIQTYTWANSSYGNGKRYVASAYPVV